MIVLYVTVVLMALVAVFCTALCVAWSIPSRRLRLASQVSGPQTGALTGWRFYVGSALISIGIAICAAIAWLGAYKVLAVLVAASW